MASYFSDFEAWGRGEINCDIASLPICVFDRDKNLIHRHFYSNGYGDGEMVLLPEKTEDMEFMERFYVDKEDSVAVMDNDCAKSAGEIAFFLEVGEYDVYRMRHGGLTMALVKN